MKLKNYIILVVICCLTLVKTIAQPAGWAHSTPLTITNTTGAYVLNYQLKLTIDTQTPVMAGEMLANGDDIRFGKDCGGTMQVNYWIESGMNTATTVIWVKIDSLPATAPLTIYMFCGNASAAPVSALQTVFFGPHSSTDSVFGGSPGGVTNSQRGFRFSSSDDILATAFGKNTPDGNMRYITLFDFATEAILRQQQVAGPAAQYAYGNLTNPIWLTAGTQYLLEIYQDVTDGYYFGAAPQVGSGLTFYDMRYCNGCTQNTFPTNIVGGMHYGYVDMWYFTKTTIASFPDVIIGVPAPANTTSAVDQNICIGNATTLTALGFNTMGWYDDLTAGNYIGGGSSYTTPVLTTTTTYYVQDSSLCGISPRTAVTVNVNPVPVLSVSGAGAICLGATSTLTASGTDAYSWNGGPAADTYNVTPSATTVYTVVGTDLITGCVDSATATVTVNSASISIYAPGLSLIECLGIDTLTAIGADSYLWYPTGETTSTIYIFNTPTGYVSYSVVGTDLNGCMDTASVSYTFSPPLPVTLDLTGNDLFCEYSPLTALSTATPSGGTWSGTGVTGTDFDPAIAGPGTFEITYTVANADGCLSSASDSVTVSASLPVMVDLTGNDLFCDYSPLTALSTAIPTGGTWSGTGVTGNDFDPAAAGVGTFGITYSVTNADGCVSSAVDSIMVSLCTGINEATHVISLFVYPNPNNGDFVLESNVDGDYSIVNQLGQAIQLVKMNVVNTHSLKVTGLSNGIYYVSFTAKGQVLRKKIVVTK